MTYFDQYNKNSGQHSKKRNCFRKNECGHNRSHLLQSVEGFDQDILKGYSQLYTGYYINLIRIPSENEKLEVAI